MGESLQDQILEVNEVKAVARRDRPAILGEGATAPGVSGISHHHDGVVGQSSTTGRSGVWGNHDGEGNGLSGSSQGGAGVYGVSQSRNGVEGHSSANHHSGVWGNNTAGGVGVAGSSLRGPGVQGDSRVGDGVLGRSQSAAHSGVSGVGFQSGAGVRGASDTGPGVHGTCRSSNNNDSSTESQECVGVWGDGPIGVRGTGATGVLGVSREGTGVRAYGDLALLVSAASSSKNLILGIAPRPDEEDVGTTTSAGPPTMNVFRVSATGAVYANGGLHGGGADVAERVLTVGPALPGDVVEIDPDHPGQFRVTSTANSTAVAGIISTLPGVSLNVQAGEDAVSAPQLALVGQVPVRASALNGPIRPGDLLVSAPLPGHAMRAPRRPKAGTVIGKAMQPLATGEDLILALVMLR